MDRLERFSMARWPKLPDLAPLGKLPNLRDLAPLASLRLTYLDLSGCEKIADLRPLARMAELAELNLTACEGITDLAPLSGLRKLTRLRLDGCKSISDLSPLAQLPCLYGLDLRGCSRVTDLTPVLGHLRSGRPGVEVDPDSPLKAQLDQARRDRPAPAEAGQR